VIDSASFMNIIIQPSNHLNVLWTVFAMLCCLCFYYEREHTQTVKALKM